MVTEEGIVTRISPEFAWVKTVRSSSCESCSARAGCNSLGGGKEMEVEAINVAGANIGDKVVLGFQTGSMIKLSFLLYVFPVLFMIAGAAIGNQVAPAYKLNPTTLSIILAFVFFAAAFFIIRFTGTKLSGNKRYRAKIIRISRNKHPVIDETIDISTDDDVENR